MYYISFFFIVECFQKWILIHEHFKSDFSLKCFLSFFFFLFAPKYQRTITDSSLFANVILFVFLLCVPSCIDCTCQRHKSRAEHLTSVVFYLHHVLLFCMIMLLTDTPAILYLTLILCILIIRAERWCAI